MAFELTAGMERWRAQLKGRLLGLLMEPRMAPELVRRDYKLGILWGRWWGPMVLQKGQLLEQQ